MGRNQNILPPPTKNGYSSVSRDYCVENEDRKIQGKRNWVSALLRHLLNSGDVLLEQVSPEMSLFPVHPFMSTKKEQEFAD